MVMVMVMMWVSVAGDRPPGRPARCGSRWVAAWAAYHFTSAASGVPHGAPTPVIGTHSRMTTGLMVEKWGTISKHTRPLRIRTTRPKEKTTLGRIFFTDSCGLLFDTFFPSGVPPPVEGPPGASRLSMALAAWEWAAGWHPTSKGRSGAGARGAAAGVWTNPSRPMGAASQGRLLECHEPIHHKSNIFGF